MCCTPARANLKHDILNTVAQFNVKVNTYNKTTQEGKSVGSAAGHRPGAP